MLTCVRIRRNLNTKDRALNCADGVRTHRKDHLTGDDGADRLVLACRVPSRLTAGQNELDLRLTAGVEPGTLPIATLAVTHWIEQQASWCTTKYVRTMSRPDLCPSAGSYMSAGGQFLMAAHGVTSMSVPRQLFMSGPVPHQTASAPRPLSGLTQEAPT